MTLEEYIAQQNALVAPMPPVDPLLQPGLGIPTATVDQMAASQPAPVEAVPPPAPVQEPTPVPAPPIPMPTPEDELAATRTNMDAQLGYTQPGLGIPRAAVDAANQNEQRLDAQHETAVDERVDNSFRTGPETELRTRYEDVADARARMSPLEAAQDDALQAQLLKERSNTEIAKAATRDREEAEAAHQAWVASRDTARQERLQIDAEAKQLNNQRAGAKDWYEEGGIGRTVTSAIMGALGGLVQHLNGGRNVGLEAVDNSINRFIAAKQADRAHQRELLGERSRSLGEQMAQNDADYREAQVYRKAAYERALQQIETDQQNYDPEGSRARAMDNARRELLAKMTAAEQAEELRRAKLLEEQAKIAREEQRLLLDRRAQDEKERAAKADERLKGWGIASENKRAQNKLDHDERRLAADILKDNRAADKEQRALDKAEEVERRELGALGDVRVKRDPATNAPVIGADGKPVVEYDALRNSDNTEWKAPDKAVAIDLAKKRAAGESVVEMIDEVLAIRDRVGGESTTFNSDDAQRLQVLEAQILALTKQGTQGMSSDEDMKVLKDAVGAKDVTSFRAKAAGLEKGRERVLATLNKEYKVVGKYTGKPIDVENRFTEAPKNTEKEEKLKALYKKPGVSVDEADRQATDIVKKRFKAQGFDLTVPERRKQFHAEVAELTADYKDISPDQRVDLQRLGDLASGSGPVAEEAMRDLQDAANNGQTEKIRKLALAAIMSAQTSQAARASEGR